MRILVAAAFVAALALAGCSGGSDQSSSSTTGTTTTQPIEDHSAKTVQVSLQGNAFVNNSVMLRTGDSIVWTHKDSAQTAHTVTSDAAANPETFDPYPNCAGPVPVDPVCMTAGKTFSHTFQKEGSYTIHCKVHGSMTMTVMVMSHNMTM